MRPRPGEPGYDPIPGTVSVLLVDPKFVHNVGAAVRAMACMQGGGYVIWTGKRVELGRRLPREERLRDYEGVTWECWPDDRPIDPWADHGFTPVCVELNTEFEQLHQFEHPKHALYVFGPEDGSLSPGVRSACHRHVSIPSYHCLNLAAAVNIVLYDRRVKRWREGVDQMPELRETRGVWHTSALEKPTR